MELKIRAKLVRLGLQGLAKTIAEVSPRHDHSHFADHFQKDYGCYRFTGVSASPVSDRLITSRNPCNVVVCKKPIFFRKESQHSTHTFPNSRHSDHNKTNKAKMNTYAICW